MDTNIEPRHAGIASSVDLVPHSRIRELAEIAMGMDGVLKLYFGESNQQTPEYIRKAAAHAMESGFTFYTENAGLPSLREALAAYYHRTQGITLDGRKEIVVTASGVQALNVAIRCVLNPGDESICLTPAWPNASSISTMVGAKPNNIAQPFQGERYGIDWNAIEAALTPRTRLLVYTSPSNPLGWVATEEDQRKLLAFCRKHGLWLLADEVYDRLWYETETLGTAVPSILRMATRDDAVIVVQSFSKTYCMTGWRVGWIATRADLAKKCAQMNEFIISNAPSFAQKAAETALAEGEPEVLKMLERLKANRDFVTAALREMPRLHIPRPEGAFYLFPQVDGMTDSFDFCLRLLKEEKVGLAPGVAFGPGGDGSIRICYAADRSILEPAMERLGRFLKM